MGLLQAIFRFNPREKSQATLRGFGKGAGYEKGDTKRSHTVGPRARGE